jgi:cytidylate kinase
MPIITISRGSYSKGKEVAEKVAQKLGYKCISREILLEASDQFKIKEIKLIRALHDAPSFLDRFTHGKERYLAYIESILLDRLQEDNVVYHGLAGHFFLKDVPHVIKVRIIADIEDRVRLEMERENISRDEALSILKKDDYERRQWSLKLYSIDTADATLYDLVIHIRKITVDNAVELICWTAGLEQFRTTAESQAALSNLALAARVKAAIVNTLPGARVTAQRGVVFVEAGAHESKHSRVAAEIKVMVMRVPGVQDVNVHVTPTPYLNQ